MRKAAKIALRILYFILAPLRETSFAPLREILYHPNTHANTNGATIVASLSTINFGVAISSLPQVIFSLGRSEERRVGKEC